MTISTLIRKTIAAGDGVTTAFNFAFQVRSAADLQVYYTDAGGVQALLASNLYSVVLNPIPSGQLWSNGGTVTYPLVGTAIAAGTKLTVARNLSLLQSSSLINQGGYYSDVVEAALDVLTMEMQQVNETIARALTLPISSTATTALPNPLAGAAIGWDATGTFITNIITVGTLPLPVPVAQGGTGAITAAAARTSLSPAMVARAANVILVQTDIATLVKATTTFTQTLTAAATLGANWYVFYCNAGTGVITLDPNGAETIDGAATVALNPGDACAIFCDGAAFYTVGRAASMVKPAFSVHRNGVAQGIANNATTTVGFTTEIFDTNNNFDTGTSKFTPTVAGKYLIEFTFLFASAADQQIFFGGIYKNAGLVKLFEGEGSGAGATGGSMSQVIDMNGTTDFIEFKVFQLFGGAVNLDGNIYASCASGIRIA